MLAATIKASPPGDDGDWAHKRYFSELTTVFELLRKDPQMVLCPGNGVSFGRNKGGREGESVCWYDDVSHCRCEDWDDIS